MYRVQYIMYSAVYIVHLQFTLYTVQHTVYTVHCTVYSVLYTLYNLTNTLYVCTGGVYPKITNLWVTLLVKRIITTPRHATFPHTNAANFCRKTALKHANLSDREIFKEFDFGAKDRRERGRPEGGN